jgi:lipoate-protein ligase A
MHYLPLTLPTLAENLACDEALLFEAEAGRAGEVLRLWEWPAAAVVLGAAGVVADDVDEHACARDVVPLGRRSSGGGTVLLGPGCLLFSLVLAYERAEELTQIGCSYCYILGKVCAALGGHETGLALAGTSDLALAGRKVSGNSQQRKRKHLLHHGTLLYNFELERIGRYLRQPHRQPDYRGSREHSEFVVNLPLHREVIEHRLRDAWQVDGETKQWPQDAVRRLVNEKYSREEWVRRR